MPHSPPNLSFLPLTYHTIDRLAGLTLAAQKSHLIQPLTKTIPQSLVSEETQAFGVFKDATPVGLIALEDARVMDHLNDTPIADCLLIWQIMVDARHERQGHGTAMVSFAKSYATLVGLDGLALATLDATEHTPLPFYEKLGFSPTGRRIQDGADDLIELVWRPA